MAIKIIHISMSPMKPFVIKSGNYANLFIAQIGLYNKKFNLYETTYPSYKKTIIKDTIPKYCYQCIGFKDWDGVASS